LCLQETHFTDRKIHNLKSYNVFYKNRTNASRAWGGVAVYVKEDVHCVPIPLTTDLEVVAVSIKLLTHNLTICNFYLPSNSVVNLEQIGNLLAALPKPYILLGDFNAHNEIWGSKRTDNRGELLRRLTENENLVLLNTGSNTRFNAIDGTFSAIDLTFSSPTIATDCIWETDTYLHGSDHYPIKITLQRSKVHHAICISPKWKICNEVT
jgi:exonuclease III